MAKHETPFNRQMAPSGQTAKVYEVSAGAWTERSSATSTITAGTAFTMTALVRAGTAAGYSTTLPAGQIGVISFGSTSNGFDDFKAHDLAGPYEVDGRYFAEVGDVQVDSGSYADVLSINNTAAQPVPVVRRGFRCETFVSTFKFKWTTPCRPGLVFGYLDPSNWWAVEIRSTDGKARLIQRTDDGPVTVLATDTTALSLTNNTWYTAKVVVDWHPTFTTSTYVQMWVDTDSDADFSDETALLGQFVTGAVGYVGLYRGGEGSTVQQFDDFKLGTDNSSPKDGDFADGGDEIAIDDNFNSNVTSLSYDNNGNLTDDGIFAFVYDAWNRLVKAKHRSASNAATIGTYAYDGAMRRTKKIVTNQGPESTANDGGDTTVNFHHDSGWRIVEDRNASNQTLRQYVDGLLYINEHLWVEINGDPTVGNDTSPDLVASGEISELPNDDRKIIHQDRNWNVIGLTAYDRSAANNGAVIEARRYLPYGHISILKGLFAVGATNQTAFTSTTGIVFGFQGQVIDNECDLVFARFRVFLPMLSIFVQRDPLGVRSGLHAYAYVNQSPTQLADPYGLFADCTNTTGGAECSNDFCRDVCPGLKFLGFTICCGAQPCYCTCPENTNHIPDDSAANIILNCVQEHELEHWAGLAAADRCSHFDCGWNPPPPPPEGSDECASKTVEFECLVNSAGQCTTQRCRDSICAYIRSQICQAYPGQRPCPGTDQNDCVGAKIQALRAYGCRPGPVEGPF